MTPGKKHANASKKTTGTESGMRPGQRRPPRRESDVSNNLPGQTAGDRRIDPSKGTGLGDTRANQNEEFGRGDQEFGGGSGNLEYGESPTREGADEGIRHADTGTEDAAEGMANERRTLGAEEEEEE